MTSAFKRLSVLEGRISYKFSDPALLYEALTHRSAVVDSQDLPWNERLEFLGDSVLGLAITRRLMSLGGDLPEGELSRMRASLVNEKSLAEIARSLDLGEFLILGRGAIGCGGRTRDSLLADALEALIGAVFQDGGLVKVEEVISRFYHERFAAGIEGLTHTDYKTVFQEWAQEHLKITPTYEVISASGPDHAKVFKVRVLLGQEVVGEGQGLSKKSASQVAAEVALRHVLENKGEVI